MTAKLALLQHSKIWIWPKFKLQTQFLHCIDQFEGDGGQNEFVDGFHIENTIRQNYPEEHNILTKTKIDFADMGNEDIVGEFHKVFQAPIFQ